MRGAHISHSGAQQSSWLAWQMAKPHEVPPDYQQLFTQLAAASADNTVALPLPVFQGAFMNDAAPVTAEVIHAQLCPQPYRASPTRRSTATLTGAPACC